MKKENETVEIKLHEQQWRYLHSIGQLGEDAGITVERLREKVGDKPQKIRTCLSELVADGLLEPDTFRLTKEGQAEYEQHNFWREELVWWMKKLRVPQDIIGPQADRLMDTMSPELIRGIHTQNEYVRTLEGSRAGQEAFYNSDLTGRLAAGSYRVKISFLSREEKVNGFLALSELNQYFEGQAELAVEPLKSALTLYWKKQRGTLEGAEYEWEGRTRRRKAAENRLAVPVADMGFTYVPAYRMLEGRLDMRVSYRRQDPAAGKMVSAVCSACLLVSMNLGRNK